MTQLIKDLALEAIVENIASDAWVFTDDELNRFVYSVLAKVIYLIQKADITDSKQKDLVNEIVSMFGIKEKLY